MDTVMLNNEVSVCAAKYSVSDSLFSALSNLERVNMVACYSNLLFDMGGQSEERWSKQGQIAYPRMDYFEMYNYSNRGKNENMELWA